jgi:hypothetical protein
MTSGVPGPSPNLLVVPQGDFAEGAWGWDHAMAHRLLLGSMAPLTRYSVIPYWIDPTQDTGPWAQDHDQAHDDFRVDLPVMWGWWYIGEQEYGIESAHQFLDTVPDNYGALAFWTFVNQQDHFIANEVTNLTIDLTFPFW